MKLKEFYDYKAKQEQELTDLESLIEKNDQALTEKEQAYKKAIAEGKDKQADAIFADIEGLKEHLKRDRYRLTVKKDMTAEIMAEKAQETVLSFRSIQEQGQKELDQLDGKATALLDELFELMSQAERIKQQTNAEISEYGRLIDFYSLNHRELNKAGLSVGNGMIKSDLQAFRENYSRMPALYTVRKPKTTDTRRERMKNLPKDATIADIAKANRIVGG